MEIVIQLTNVPIAGKSHLPVSRAAGVWLEFRGVVRGEENGQPISALEYEVYPKMAEREIRRLLESLAAKYPCLAARVIHRTGIIPVGETAIYVGVTARHRAEALALVAEFMDRLKQDVPIWKRRALPANPAGDDASSVFPPVTKPGHAHGVFHKSLDEVMAEINARCRPLPPVRASLEASFGRVLREMVSAQEDLPAHDLSTRDGYAMLAEDSSESFRIVDTIHAGDWKPHSLQPGEAVRLATGAALPCGGLRVVMQENAERNGDSVRILKRDASLNVRKRGEDMQSGQLLVRSGECLGAGKLALLATAGCTQPLVSPRLRVAHFTTGDELVSPERTPESGQIRDSNSILMRGLLQRWPSDVFQAHLPEEFTRAKAVIENHKSEIEQADLVLVSGGASVGDKDFTRQLLESLGFVVAFSQVHLRPGKPLIFAVNGSRVAFGLPGNPLSHFVCFHFGVAAAMARLSGHAGPKFLRGRLGAGLDDTACPRETLWPALLDWNRGSPQLHPLAWASSGDVTCLAEANALIRLPANCAPLDAEAELDFLPTANMLGG